MTTITRHPQIRGGRPVIRNTRIDPATIRRMWEDGYDVPAICAEYPHLSSGQIMAALSYERSVRRRVERWTARRLQGVARCGLRLGMWLGDWSERWA